ncbi:MAG: zonular occludens toxin domain-containing protein [Oscillospiraceae bacterium]|nr:zonular occludens toxin domain-containing protein [Oscillospiraceae bacterium]
MIQAVCGTVGGGKTLYAVLQIYEALRRGCHVSTNIHLVGWDHGTGAIDLSKGMFKRLAKYRRIKPTQLQYLDFDAISNLAAVLPAGRPDARNIVVLDEVNEWFDSVDRDKIRTDSDFRNIQRFFRQSRKVYTDIYLVLQDFNTLNNRVRSLVSHVMFSRDLANLKAGIVPIGFLLRNWFFRRLYDNQSKTLTWRSMCRKETYAYNWYDTYQTYGGAIVGGGQVDSAGEKVKPWYLRNLAMCAVIGLQVLVIAVMCAGFYFLRYSGVDHQTAISHGMQTNAVINAVSVASNVVKEKTVVVGCPAPVVEFEVSTWKIITERGREVVQFVDGRRYNLGDYTEFGRLDKMNDRRLEFATTNGWRMVDWVSPE